MTPIWIISWSTGHELRQKVSHPSERHRLADWDDTILGSVHQQQLFSSQPPLGLTLKYKSS